MVKTIDRLNNINPVNFVMPKMIIFIISSLLNNPCLNNKYQGISIFFNCLKFYFYFHLVSLSLLIGIIEKNLKKEEEILT